MSCLPPYWRVSLTPLCAFIGNYWPIIPTSAWPKCLLLIGFHKLGPRYVFPLVFFFSVVYYQKKKKKGSEWTGLQLNIFLVRNFFINNRCCRVMHAATLNISLIWLCFLQKGLQFTLQSIKLSGFFPHCGPKELKSFNINRAYLSFLDS